MKLEIRPISAEAARPLRQRILRPGQRADQLIYEGDAEGLHLGAFLGEHLVGVASFLEPEGHWWRLRGMAVDAGQQGKGTGGALLTAGFECLPEAGIYCNARLGAAEFYRRHGFISVSNVYDMPGIGPHLRMERPPRQFAQAPRT